LEGDEKEQEEQDAGKLEREEIEPGDRVDGRDQEREAPHRDRGAKGAARMLISEARRRHFSGNVAFGNPTCLGDVLGPVVAPAVFVVQHREVQRQ